jgi:hypothetical protein
MSAAVRSQTTNSDGIDPSLLPLRKVRYSHGRAVEVVEGATHAIVVTGVSTMLALGIVLNIVGLGFFCWVLFTLATHALAVFVGMTAGLYAHESGTAPLGAIALGIVTAAFVLVIGQTIFSCVRTPILRIAVTLMFAAPATLAGYHATFGLSGLTMTSDIWRQVFAVISAVVIGATAWARLAASRPTDRSDPEGRPYRKLGDVET